MCLLVDVFIELVLGNRHGMVCAELLQAVKTCRQGKHDQRIFFLDTCNVLVLLFLLQVPTIHGEYSAEYRCKRADNRADRDNGTRIDCKFRAVLPPLQLLRVRGQPHQHILVSGCIRDLDRPISLIRPCAYTVFVAGIFKSTFLGW